jgi:hypothetical protein
MSEQSPLSIGDEVFVITADGDRRTGVLAGSNANTMNEKLLYTIKIENSFWVGSAIRVFPKETTVEEAMELLRKHDEKQTQELLDQQARREEEEHRLAEAEESEEPEPAEDT